MLLQFSSAHIYSPFSVLPKAVKRRVHALKKMQLQCAHIEAKFYGEIHELERKYAALYQPLFDKVTTRPPTSDLSFSLAPPGPLLSAADCILNH